MSTNIVTLRKYKNSKQNFVTINGRDIPDVVSIELHNPDPEPQYVVIRLEVAQFNALIGDAPEPAPPPPPMQRTVHRPWYVRLFGTR